MIPHKECFVMLQLTGAIIVFLAEAAVDDPPLLIFE